VEFPALLNLGEEENESSFSDTSDDDNDHNVYHKNHIINSIAVVMVADVKKRIIDIEYERKHTHPIEPLEKLKQIKPLSKTETLNKIIEIKARF
jgi:hypothetical protein